jgi:hypothetical protein
MDEPRFKRATALRDSGCYEDAMLEFRGMAIGASDANEKAALISTKLGVYPTQVERPRRNEFWVRFVG